MYIGGIGIESSHVVCYSPVWISIYAAISLCSQVRRSLGMRRTVEVGRVVLAYDVLAMGANPALQGTLRDKASRSAPELER